MLKNMTVELENGLKIAISCMEEKEALSLGTKYPQFADLQKQASASTIYKVTFDFGASKFEAFCFDHWLAATCLLFTRDPGLIAEHLSAFVVGDELVLRYPHHNRLENLLKTLKTAITKNTPPNATALLLK